jgi:hypothetical protein
MGDGVLELVPPAADCSGSIVTSPPQPLIITMQAVTRMNAIADRITFLISSSVAIPA